MMMKKDEFVVMRAIALCFKPYLKPEESLIYCNLARTQFAKRSNECGIFKNEKGYYKREDLDVMCSESLGKNLEEVKFLLRKKKNCF